ncbi:MAG: LuxR C-terminal-related transcriptional regulator [Cyclobacteriaceae bacterium]
MDIETGYKQLRYDLGYFADKVSVHQKEKIIQRLESAILMPGQFSYLTEVQSLQIVWNKGVANSLGISEKDISFNSIGQKIHPDDRPKVIKAMEEVAHFAMVNKPKPRDYLLTIQFRMKKDDGSYIKVMRQSSVLLNDKQGLASLVYSIYSNVSEVMKYNGVTWSLLKNHESAQSTNSFKIEGLSDRERQVFQFLQDGLTSKQIAKKLKISHHTVDTHRRSILKKSGEKSTKILLIKASQAIR